MSSCHRSQPRALSKPRLLERRVSHDRDAPLGAPGDHPALDPAARQVVQHLVRLDLGAARQPRGLLHLADVEVADSVVPDLALLP